jgi:hypothetical protein
MQTCNSVHFTDFTDSADSADAVDLDNHPESTVWGLGHQVEKSGFYWNTDNPDSPYRRLVRIYKKSATSMWVEDQYGCHSVFDKIGYYIVAGRPDIIVAEARSHPNYDVGRFARKLFPDTVTNAIRDDRCRGDIPKKPSYPKYKQKIVTPDDEITHLRWLGFHDGLMGLSFDANPFMCTYSEARSDKYHAWFSGWFDAQDVLDGVAPAEVVESTMVINKN